MKRFFSLFLAGIPALAPAATIMETYSFAGFGVPDGDPSGAVGVEMVAGSEITEIESVMVTVDISGTHNGDLYAYLANGSGLSVLLNRPGRTAADSIGYADDGVVFTFSDAAPVNSHNYRNQVTPMPGSQATGTFQPDGRTTDPGVVLDTDTPSSSAALSVFNGAAADGEWRLFVADLSGGDSHSVDGWSIDLVGVPEPSSAVLGLLALSALGLRRRR